MPWCAARTCSPRHLVSQIKRQLRVEKCEAEQATAKKRKADQQEAAQVAVQREMLAKAFKRARTTGTWTETAAAQGEAAQGETCCCAKC